jgi:hypothetical protein
VDDQDQQLFLAADGDRIACALLTALDQYAWPLGWATTGGIELRGETAVIAPRRKVARVWTARDYRGRRIALRLLQMASRLLPTPISDLGWELPFTPAGSALVRRLCPEAFWGCGDRFTLYQALRPPTAPDVASTGGREMAKDR